MNVKKVARIRRAKRARAKISELRMNRLCVYRSPRHIYAQVIAPTGDVILASASTVEKDARGGKTGNVDAAGKVGKLIAERAKADLLEFREELCSQSRTVGCQRHGVLPLI